MVSIFLPEKSKKMHNLSPFGKFFIKKPEEIKRRYKIRKKEVSLHERTGLHRTHRCNHRSRQLGLDRILPPRPRRPDLRNMTWLSRIIYAVVGICGLYLISVYGRISDHVLGQA